MKFKKVMALALASTMVFSMAACGGSKDDGGSSDAGDSKKEEKSEGGDTLSISIWDSNQEPGINEILADFTEETGIKTKLTVVKWD